MKDFTTELGRDDHILGLCHMLSNKIGKAFTSEMLKDDITVTEWRIFLTLVLNERTSGQEITNRWAMEKMTVNRTITSLERRGLIEKKRNLEDRRTKDLLLTPAGHALYEKQLPAANRRYHKLVSCLDKSEVKLLKQLLTKMIAHTDSIID